MSFSSNEKILCDFFIEREGKGILKVIRDLDLIDEGILDSLDIVSLAAYLQKNFNKKIDVTEPKILKAFHKFEDIMKIIE